MAKLPSLRTVRGKLAAEADSGFARIYVFILVFVLVVVLVFAYALVFKSKKISERAENGGVELNRVENFQMEGLEKQKTYTGYVSLFEIVMINYKNDPSERNKDRLNQISAQAKADFPQEYNDADFIVPCLETAGCNGVTDGAVTTLIAAIENSSVEDSKFFKTPVISELRALQSYEPLEDKKEIGYYNSAYSASVTVYDLDRNDEELRQALVDFEGLIAQKFPEQYVFYRDYNTYKLTNIVNE